MVERLAASWLSQNDVHAATVGSASRDGADFSEQAIRFLQAAIVFVLELVLERRGDRIPLSPEDLDERVTLFDGSERQKDFALALGDDVGDLVLEPAAMFGCQALSRRSS